MTTKAEREARQAELEAAQASAAGESLPKGVDLAEAKPAEVDAKAYPERPYSEAVTEEHKARLKEADQLP